MVKPQAAAGTAGKDSPREPFPEGDAMDRFVSVFEASARRWELVIYPAMLAFVVLAGYGFFLIYTLSKDISPPLIPWASTSTRRINALFPNVHLNAPRIN